MDQFPNVVNLEKFFFHSEDLEFSVKEEIEEILKIVPTNLVNDWRKIIPNERFMLFENIINYNSYNILNTPEYKTDIDNLILSLYQKISTSYDVYKQILETNKYYIVYLEREDIDKVRNNEAINSTFYTNIIQQNQGVKCPDNQFSIIKNADDTFTKIPCCDTICPQTRLKLGSLAMITNNINSNNVIVEDGKYYWFIISVPSFKAL
jgi:hypothetical protein